MSNSIDDSELGNEHSSPWWEFADDYLFDSASRECPECEGRCFDETGAPCEFCQGEGEL